MSNPLWREARPNSPYGGEPGDRPRGRDSRVPIPRGGRRSWAGGRPPPAGCRPTARPPVAPQPGAARRAERCSPPSARPAAAAGGRARPRPDAERYTEAQVGGRCAVWEGSLSGGLGVAIVASTALGASRHHGHQEPARFDPRRLRHHRHARRGGGRAAADRPADPPGPGAVLPGGGDGDRGDLRPLRRQDGAGHQRGPVDRQRVLRHAARHRPGRRADHGPLVPLAPRSRPGPGGLAEANRTGRSRPGRLPRSPGRRLGTPPVTQPAQWRPEPQGTQGQDPRAGTGTRNRRPAPRAARPSVPGRRPPDPAPTTSPAGRSEAPGA